MEHNEQSIRMLYLLHARESNSSQLTRMPDRLANISCRHQLWMGTVQDEEGGVTGNGMGLRTW
jgi:hypothetical protein